MPQRIQLRRTKGWRKPEGAVVVSRPSKWGNPFRASSYPATVRTADGEGFLQLSDYQRRELAVNDFEAFLLDAIRQPWGPPAHNIQFRIIAESLPELTGRDLACWCPLDRPCHADVLLEVANSSSPVGVDASLRGTGSVACADPDGSVAPVDAVPPVSRATDPQPESEGL